MSVGSRKRLFFVGFASVLVIFAFVGHGSDEAGPVRNRRTAKIPRQFDPGAKSMRTYPGRRRDEFFKVFHLDLKGAPPKVSYLTNLLPLIRRAGANALLIEYEDMFPYVGPLANISAGNAYSLRDLKTLVTSAESLDMEVIPLVQTFGHLEYVLKLGEFQHLRELDSFPQEICPKNTEALNVVKELIRQVMNLHVNSRYIHIGCDEVRHIGACPVCSKSYYKKIFSLHVTEVAHYVKTQWPGVTPLAWDDMFRSWTLDEITKFGLATAIEPVVWAYGENIFTLVSRRTWTVYLKTFPRIWVASAFKGAFGERETMPNLKRHLENNLAWKEVMKISTGRREQLFAGIVITGWSRYDHFAVLCELLPTAVPSLILSLLCLGTDDYGDGGPSANDESFIYRWLDLLRCPDKLTRADLNRIHREKLFQDKLGVCSFPGHDLYSLVLEFQGLRGRMKKFLGQIESSGWATEYNLENNFTSPWRLLELSPGEGFAGSILKKDLADFEYSITSVMTGYYDNHTIREWQDQNIRPMEAKLSEIETTFQNLMGRKWWPRRPVI